MATAQRVESPTGKVTIVVHSASDLYNTQTIGTQDPYVKVTIEAGKKERRPFKTGVADNAKTNPKWEKEFVTNLVGDETAIRFDVWNKNPLSDDLIGTMSVRPVDVPLNPGKTRYQLTRKKGKVAAGFLTLSITPESMPQTRAAAAPAAAPKGVPPPQPVHVPAQQMSAYGAAPVYRPYGQPAAASGPVHSGGQPPQHYQPAAAAAPQHYQPAAAQPQQHYQPAPQQQYYQPPQQHSAPQQQHYQPQPQPQQQQQQQYYQPQQQQAPAQPHQQQQYYQPAPGQQQQQYYRPPQ